ncbi:MAG: hypothetical protein EXQ56_12365 [Acidobacteria bacterium]|nr:hypothetical protein [Acidobacteriota bacterium]
MRFSLTSAGIEIAGQVTIAWYDAVSSSHQTVWNHVHSSYSQRIPHLVQVPELAEDIAGLPALQHIARHLKAQQLPV